MNDLRVPEKKYRPELEGIRALAAILVAVYHIWLGKVSGGVDVFFIVSGFLITTSLLNRYERDGKINIIEYVLGLLRRLLPLALIVILFNIIMSIFILPKSQWMETIPHIFSSMFYYQNWQLANEAVDYLAQNNQASPFQHYWALSLQGQFYILWPMIILFSAFLATKVLKLPIRKTLLGFILLLFVFSFLYSVYITIVNQPWGYFDTFARLWEFSLGGILALLLSYITIKKRFSLLLGWLGVIVISLTGLILPVSTLFPGIAALLPTFGVILVIISAENRTSWSVVKLLGSKLFVFLGSVSYGFYLWHWPILIFYLVYFQVETVPFTHGLFIMIVSFILSYVTTRLLEQPVRTLNVKTAKPKIIGALTIFIVPTLMAAFIWMNVVNEMQNVDGGTIVVQDYPGALAIYENIIPAEDVELRPNPVNAPNDTAHFYYDENCYTRMNESTPKVCSFGNTENPKYTIALVGGSHSGHWFTAVEEIAINLDLQLDIYIRDACRFSTQDFNGRLDESCMKWNDEVVELLMESQPDIIFTTATVFGSGYIPDGYKEMWRKFEGISAIFAIRDIPRMEEKIPNCIETKGIEECSVPREEVLFEITEEDLEDMPSHVVYADFTEFFCDEETCQPVIGNIIVYRDEHHLTASYVKTLVKPLEERIREVIDYIEKTNE